MSARALACLAGGVCCVAQLRCSSAEERPAPYTAPGESPENPRGCRDIQPGTAVGTEIWLGGEPAQCIADGLACPLGPAFSLGESCNPGGASAHCVGQRWVLRCLDGGAP